jgi:hypothetical protein
MKIDTFNRIMFFSLNPSDLNQSRCLDLADLAIIKDFKINLTKINM